MNRYLIILLALLTFSYLIPAQAVEYVSNNKKGCKVQILNKVTNVKIKNIACLGGKVEMTFQLVNGKGEGRMQSKKTFMLNKSQRLTFPDDFEYGSNSCHKCDFVVKHAKCHFQEGRCNCAPC